MFQNILIQLMAFGVMAGVVWLYKNGFIPQLVVKVSLAAAGGSLFGRNVIFGLFWDHQLD